MSTLNLNLWTISLGYNVTEASQSSPCMTFHQACLGLTSFSSNCMSDCLPSSTILPASFLHLQSHLRWKNVPTLWHIPPKFGSGCQKQCVPTIIVAISMFWLALASSSSDISRGTALLDSQAVFPFQQLPPSSPVSLLPVVISFELLKGWADSGVTFILVYWTLYRSITLTWLSHLLLGTHYLVYSLTYAAT